MMALSAELSVSVAMDACACVFALLLAVRRVFMPGRQARLMSGMGFALAVFCVADAICLLNKTPAHSTIPISIVSIAALTAYAAFFCWYAWLCRQRYGSIPVLLFMPVAAFACQLLAGDLAVFGILCACGLLLTIMSVQVKHERHLALSRIELNGTRAEAVLSQVQPHFLFNTLTAIRSLCRIDPGRAATVLDDFSAYVHACVESLGCRDAVAFDVELAHTQTYLHLEELRLGDRLRCEQDIRERDVCLPSLTLQALVENVVRNEVSKREEGGCVRIASYREGDVVYVTAECDGGASMSPRPEDVERSQRRIRNVRRRVELMCGGTVDIGRTRRGGTCATVRIPRGAGERVGAMGGMRPHAANGASEDELDGASSGVSLQRRKRLKKMRGGAR